MAREKFLDIAFRSKTVLLIQQANSIIETYQDRGVKLTVRALFYRFVARNILANTPQNYERVASVIDDGRKAGLVDWSAIEDRTRFLRGIADYADPTDWLSRNIDAYAEDIWADQDYYCETWIEKDAALGTVEGVCDKFRVPLFSCRGYPSSSELYYAAKRLERVRRDSRQPIVFYIGDHDPSGLQMTDNASNALATFARTNQIEFRRICLTMDQIDEYDPPENYAKESDSRYNWYVEQTGRDAAWELDALDPIVIADVLSDAIKSVCDKDRFKASVRLEAENWKRLAEINANFDGVQRYMTHRAQPFDNGYTVDEALSYMDRL